MRRLLGMLGSSPQPLSLLPRAAGAFQQASEALGLTGRNSGALRGQALLHPIDGSDRGGVHVNTPFNREGWACMST